MALVFVSICNVSKAQVLYSEDFAVVSPLPAGWASQNLSSPVGTTGWFQGNSAVFPSQNGAPTAYIGANFNNTTGANTISNWLFMPNITLKNGDVFTFYTRTPTANPFPDRLQVRMSTNGASANAGATATSIGDFTTLLLDINPLYQTGGVYPEVWTQFSIIITGVPVPISGRLAFRYFVENGGPSGANSNYIGIDNAVYTATTGCTSVNPVPNQTVCNNSPTAPVNFTSSTPTSTRQSSREECPQGSSAGVKWKPQGPEHRHAPLFVFFSVFPWRSARSRPSRWKSSAPLHFPSPDLRDSLYRR